MSKFGLAQRLLATFYQPQVDEWTDYRQLDGRVTVVLTPAGGQSVPGMITLEAQTSTNMEDRTVVFHDTCIRAVFPSLDEAAQQKIRSCPTTRFLNNFGFAEYHQVGRIAAYKRVFCRYLSGETSQKQTSGTFRSIYTRDQSVACAQSRGSTHL